jgi:hypothetical protein
METFRVRRPVKRCLQETLQLSPPLFYVNALLARVTLQLALRLQETPQPSLRLFCACDVLSAKTMLRAKVIER